MLTVAQLNYANIDAQIALCGQDQLQVLWQQLLDARSSLPPTDRFFELKGMLEDHVIPVFQAYQGTDVVACRAATFSSVSESGYEPLSPIVLEMVTRAYAFSQQPKVTPATTKVVEAVPVVPVVVGQGQLEANLSAAISAMLQSVGSTETRSKMNSILNDLL